MVKAVIFDMDGVLVDTEPLQIERQKEFLTYLGTPLPEKELMKMVGTNKKMAFQLISKYNHDFKNYLAYYDAYNFYYMKQPIDYTKLINDGVLDLLKWLKVNDLKIALASSGSKEKITSVLQQNQLNKYFDAVVSGDSFKESKPNPEIYFKVSEKVDVLPGNCLVIEDSNYGIEAAKRAGMYTIAKKEKRFPFSQEKADIIIESFDEVKKLIKERIR